MSDTTVLSRTPRLMPALGKGVLTGIGKRPHPGAALPPTRLVLPAARIDPADVAAYARVCGFPETGPLPLTYPHILGFPLAARLMSARAFPLPLLGLVHTTLEIEQYTQLEIEDYLELSVRAEELRAHRRGTEVVMTTEARRAGRLVWVDRSGYLARHRVPDDHEGSTPEEPSPDLPTLPVRDRWQLPAGLGRRHAAVSGDYNPIHLHPLTARPLGFPRAIAHGMWTAARCAAAAVPAGAAAVRLTAAFRAPVLLPATVSYAQRDTADGTVAFQLRGDTGERPRVHLSGTVELLPGPAAPAD
ncbi:MaoC/PaaZ C-terminal domain-containing protein [Streptomyces sp. NPDC048650]|uniref:MaoC/PaaZ C-terminal domain-containing protein n=1 Tax=unclassified Streptomyces TaxID=2593676 RepID=UPI0037225F6E